jgi:glyoxylase-like metal-dependent hydrolase (beta-lactamase superfamily II)
MLKIVEDVWQVGGEGLTALGDAAVYLIRFGHQAALIDAGCGTGHWELVDNISLCLPPEADIVYLLLTHCHYDHVGGAAHLRDQYGCKIVAHQKDARYLESGDSEVTAATWYGSQLAPLKVDHHISATNDTITIGTGQIQAYHCPGHSPGSLVFTAQCADQLILFGQDVHGPLHPSLRSNREDYLKSLQFMLDLGADILCEGHFGVIKGKDAVRRFIRSYLAQ